MDAELFIAKPTAIPTVYKAVRAPKRTNAAKYMNVKDAARILKIGNLGNNLGDRLMRHTLEVAPYDAYDSPIFVRTKLYENKNALVLEEYVRDRLALREKSPERTVIKMTELARMFKDGERVDPSGLWVTDYSISMWEEYYGLDQDDQSPAFVHVKAENLDMQYYDGPDVRLIAHPSYEFDTHSAPVVVAWSCLPLLRHTGEVVSVDCFLEHLREENDQPRGWGRVDAYDLVAWGIIGDNILDAIERMEAPFALGAAYEDGRCLVHVRHMLKACETTDA